jgi:Cold shock proteins
MKLNTNSEKTQGKVKWFNNAKGFGFICADSFSDDIFAHFSQIDMDGFLTLKAGQSVFFEIEKTPRGFHAKNILPVNSAGT